MLMSDDGQDLDTGAAMNQSAAQRPWQDRFSVVLVGIATFFYWAAMYLYVPVLPVYAQNLGASLSMVGIIVAAYALPQALLRIPIGLWSDALGKRRPIVIGGLAMTVIGSLGLILAPSPWFIVLSRMGVGVGAAIWVDFTVYFVSFYAPQNTGKAVGLLNFLAGAAQVASTLFGGIITDAWGPKSAFLGAMILGLIALVALLPAREAREINTSPISWESFKKVATRPLLVAVSVMAGLLYFAQFTGVWGYISVYGAKIGATNTELGILSMLSISASMVISLAVAGMVKRWGYTACIVLASLLLSSSLIAVPFVQNLHVLDFIQVVNGAGKGILATSLMSLSIHAVAPQQRATAMGFYQAVYAVGMLIGPLISGFLADSFGLATIFYLCGTLILAVAVMAFLTVMPKKI